MTQNKQPEIPANCRYASSHEWARQEGNEVSVGITAHAVEEMGRDIVHVELPPTGQRVVQAQPFGVIDSIKSAFELFSPVTGEVVAVNDKVAADPMIVAQSPYRDGWMIRIKPDDPRQLEQLLSPEQYKQMIFLNNSSH
jgi:glycine cleavage system H protein